MLCNCKDIRSFAYELVMNKKVCYSHLNDDEKKIFTGLIIKNNKPIYAQEYVTESDKNDELPYLLADLLISKNQNITAWKENIELFIDFICNIACKYASEEIDKILESVEEQYNHDRKFYCE